MAREKMKDARRGDAAAGDASSWARLIRRLPSSSSHCRLQERTGTDTLALSIYHQIHGPKLEDTSSVLLLRSASSSSAGGERRE
jgi:hypothetical protein